MNLKHASVGTLTALLSLLAACSASAQETFWYIPHAEESKTPIELELQGSELAMPGFGIGSTRACLIKRFEHALEHKWLTSQQVEQLCNELKSITDKEQSQRDETGKLSFESRLSLARHLNGLNDRFEEMVLVREQSNPGVEGLRARGAMLSQRINYGLSAGKLTAKRAQTLKAELVQANSEIPKGKEIDSDLAKKIASDLSKVNNSLERDLRGPSIANRISPYSR